MNLTDGNTSTNQQDYAGTSANSQNCGSTLTPYGYQEMNRVTMSSKLSKIAELFEQRVLSEEDALKACKTVIGQHTYVTGGLKKD